MSRDTEGSVNRMTHPTQATVFDPNLQDDPAEMEAALKKFADDIKPFEKELAAMVEQHPDYPTQATAEEVIAREISENYDDSLNSIKLAGGIVTAIHSAGYRIVDNAALEALVRAAELAKEVLGYAANTHGLDYQAARMKLDAALLPFKDAA